MKVYFAVSSLLCACVCGEYGDFLSNLYTCKSALYRAYCLFGTS